MSWTDAKIARLSKLWAEGVSASGIARALGDVSRSAVLGKLQRLNLLKTRRTASAPRSFGGEAADAKLASAFASRRPRREPPPSPWRAAVFRPLPGSWPRPWIARGLKECAFPVGGEGAATLACCRPCQGASAYCAAHHAIVYRPASAALQADRWAA